MPSLLLAAGVVALLGSPPAAVIAAAFVALSAVNTARLLTAHHEQPVELRPGRCPPVACACHRFL